MSVCGCKDIVEGKKPAPPDGAMTRGDPKGGR